MTPNRRLRLACHGWVHEHAGSVASAGYVVLAELLRRGVAVDLFAHRAHVPPPPGLTEAGCRYFGFDPSGLPRAIDRIPGPWVISGRLLSPLSAGIGGGRTGRRSSPSTRGRPTTRCLRSARHGS